MWDDTYAYIAQDKLAASSTQRTLHVWHRPIPLSHQISRIIQAKAPPSSWNKQKLQMVWSTKQKIGELNRQIILYQNRLNLNRKKVPTLPQKERTGPSCKVEC